MKRTEILVLLAALAVIVFFPPSGVRAQGGVSPSSAQRLDYVPGEVLVKYKTERETSAVQTSLMRMSAEIKKSYPRLGLHQVKLSPAMSVPQALQAFRNDPSVAYAEPNYLRYIDATTPNDTYFRDFLWGLHNTGQNVNGTAGTPGADIHGPEAWDITRGSSTVKVAVIDTGVDYNHPDLTGNLSSTLRYDFVNSDANPMDANNHGTHVAGTIAAVGNNGLGVTGVSWTATIMPLRAAGAFGTLTTSSIIAAIDYAIANGARIINASYGGPTPSDFEYAAISRARDAGILFVAAARNEGKNNDTTPVYPANYQLDNIISVAATDQNDNLAHFSNYGAASVHVGAPGANIYSTKPARQDWTIDLDTLTGWTTGGTNNTWGLSTTTYYSSPSSLAVNPRGNASDSWAEPPVRNLSGAVGCKLEFRFHGAPQSADDFLAVETSTDRATWTRQDIYITGPDGRYLGTTSEISGGGFADDWYNAAVDLGAYDGVATVYTRFHSVAMDAPAPGMGWFIDDMIITAASTAYAGDEYRVASGTSMAAPHVTGLAALIWGFKPELTYAQVKSIIINSVDLKTSLAGLTISGGRVNAFNALYYTPPPAPGSLAAAVTSDNAISLTWTDNSPNESGFHIERRPGSGTYAQVAAVAANSVTYGDTGLSAGTAYCYRVAAFNNGGNSDYSNEVCATTTGTAPAGGGGGGGGGGCFIATAAFGSPWEGHVQTLRAFRDSYLMGSHAGRTCVELYYRVSPPLAEVISSNDALRMVTRWCLIPFVGMAYLFVHFGPVLTCALFLSVALLIGVSFRLYAARSRRFLRRA